MKKQKIVIGIGAKVEDVEFNVDIIKYNAFLNAGAGKNKAAALNNFLVNCTQGEHKAKLQTIMANEPGAATCILESLLDTYAPDVPCVVKTSTTVPSESETTL